MSKEEIFEELGQVLSDSCWISEGEYLPKDTCLNDLGLDSLDTVEIIMECEKKFNISIPDDDIPDDLDDLTLEKLVNIIELHIK